MALAPRLAVLGGLAALFLVISSAARHYSPRLIGAIVEQALIEKAPAGTEPAWVRSRVAAILAEKGEDAERLDWLLAASQRLEKVQVLTRAELEHLLESNPDAPHR